MDECKEKKHEDKETKEEEIEEVMYKKDAHAMRQTSKKSARKNPSRRRRKKRRNTKKEHKGKLVEEEMHLCDHGRYSTANGKAIQLSHKQDQ